MPKNRIAGSYGISTYLELLDFLNTVQYNF